MPDQLPILQRRSRAHHSINPLWVEKRLVDIRRPIIPLALHIQIIAPLQRNRAPTPDLIAPDRTRERDLPGHARAADDGRLQVELLDHGRDRADVGVLAVGVHARVVALVRERAAVRGEVDGRHAAFAEHARVVHHAVVLAAVGARGVQEEDVLVSRAGLLVELVA